MSRVQPLEPSEPGLTAVLSIKAALCSKSSAATARGATGGVCWSPHSLPPSPAPLPTDSSMELPGTEGLDAVMEEGDEEQSMPVTLGTRLYLRLVLDLVGGLLELADLPYDV